MGTRYAQHNPQSNVGPSLRHYSKVTSPATASPQGRRSLNPAAPRAILSRALATSKSEGIAQLAAVASGAFALMPKSLENPRANPAQYGRRAAQAGIFPRGDERSIGSFGNFAVPTS